MIFIDFHRIPEESYDFLDFVGFPENAGPIFLINSLIKCFIRVQFSGFSKDFLEPGWIFQGLPGTGVDFPGTSWNRAEFSRDFLEPGWNFLVTFWN